MSTTEIIAAIDEAGNALEKSLLDALTEEISDEHRELALRVAGAWIRRAHLAYEANRQAIAAAEAMEPVAT